MRLRDLRSDNSAISSPALSMRALALVARALGPRRSHSISMRTRFSSALWCWAWACRNSAFCLQEGAVIAGDVEHAVGIDAVELGHSGRHVFQEIAIVADDDAGERRGLQQFLQPLDAGQVQMIGGFVEQDDFRFLHQSFGDGEPLAPAARKRFGFGVEIAEAGAA